MINNKQIKNKLLIIILYICYNKYILLEKVICIKKSINILYKNIKIIINRKYYIIFINYIILYNILYNINL